VRVLTQAGVVLFALLAASSAQGDDASAGSSSSGTGLAAATRAYKDGESWPFRVFRGFDFAEPLLPLAAIKSGDAGRIALDSALPYSMLVTAFAARSTDRTTLAEVERWHWAGLDEKQDNYPTLYGFCLLSGLSLLLPAPVEDTNGYSLPLRLDRVTVFGLGIGAATLEAELLKPVFHRQRPNGQGFSSRPSGHASTAFAGAAFFSDVLRDALQPVDEHSLPIRLGEEIACAVPYLGAAYISLERVHGRKHFLTDTLLGGALGALTMDMLYSWSFVRLETGRPWLEKLSLGYDPAREGAAVTITLPF
jgi:hypothetical protein